VPDSSAAAAAAAAAMTRVRFVSQLLRRSACPLANGTTPFALRGGPTAAAAPAGAAAAWQAMHSWHYPVWHRACFSSSTGEEKYVTAHQACRVWI
jgi:hypothetical protein